MDAIDLLIQDHETVKGLLKQYDAVKDNPGEKRRVAERIIRELMTHERIEEDIFYPAFKKAADAEGRELVAEAKEEHHVVDLLIDELQDLSLDDEEFDAKFAVMKENIEHHIQEEEGEMFPDARNLLQEELDDLADAMQEYKDLLLQSPSEKVAQRR